MFVYVPIHLIEDEYPVSEFGGLLKVSIGSRRVKEHSGVVRCFIQGLADVLSHFRCILEEAGVWDFEKGEELVTLKGHSGSINAVAVIPGGVLLIIKLQKIRYIAYFAFHAGLLCI